VLAIVNANTGKADQQKKFRALVERYADVPAISVFSLGKYARDLPGARKAEYNSLMQNYLARLFLNHIETFRGEKVEIVGTKARSERDVIVSTNLIYTDGRKLAIAWRLVKRGDGYKIFDASIGGVWLAVQQQSSFVSTISQNGGKVDALIDYLKKSVGA
jgi:phospholipid transport system substrate-binding protein